MTMSHLKPSDGPDVSVIIPCYQQGHFLSEAIETVLAQTWPAKEIIVIDDGSRDNTAAVAARYPSVRYIYQDNSGSASARNRGISESKGSYLVFLDADDRLLSKALEIGVSSLGTHPESAFVFGRCQHIRHDGSPDSVFQQSYDESDDYLAMLRGNPIWHPAAVMCRRSVIETINGFDTSLVACSDYEFYLKVTRISPVYCHNCIISEYRQHSANKTSNNPLTLNSLTRILRSQLPLIRGKKKYEEAYQAALINMQSSYYGNSIRQVRSFLKTGSNREHLLRNVMLILRLGPVVCTRSALLRLQGPVKRIRKRFWNRGKIQLSQDASSQAFDRSLSGDGHQSK
jgi:glycosyltransferase involved in cell wall biosynthesis